jgi:hypothetical protein
MNIFAKSDLPNTAIYHDKQLPQKPRILQSDPEFARNDWAIYISNLPQRAGVPTQYIRKLLLKELADNGLDEMDQVGHPGMVTIVQDAEHTYTVTDSGRGFDDTPEELAYRFSIAKAMVSSKQWRKPTRGCVGNGLRVIVGAVASGGGRIIVKTRDRQVTLRPRIDGITTIEDIQKIDWPVGTAITVEIDPAYPASGDTLEWAQLAIQLARNSDKPFLRKPSPWWFDADHLSLNMLAAIDPAYTLAWFVSQLDRCSSREIGQQVTARFGKGRLCRDLSKPEATELLNLLRRADQPVITPKQLGPMKSGAWKHEQLNDGYACEKGTFESGRSPHAQIPFLVEAWAATCETQFNADDDYDDDVYSTDIIGFTINRSPVIVQFDSFREGRSRNVSLVLGDTRCELSVPKGAFRFALNITSPHIPILGDNKTPSLNLFRDSIQKVVEAAIRRSARKSPPQLISRRDDEDGDEGAKLKSPKNKSQRSQVLAILEDGEAIAEASGDGSLSFNQRSLYYVVRTRVRGLEAGYFGQLVTEYENEYDEIPGMFRNNRGAFYEPHTSQVIPLGTLTVESYRRSPWLYQSVSICEKEDNVHMLRQSGFAERWDCFLLSSSGFTTRALKDLIDYIGSTASDEPVRVFSMIDADAHGSVIFQTLVRETKARAARKIEVVNLGLFPWEGMANGLQHESGLIEQNRKKNKGKFRRTKVADYIIERDQHNQRTGNPNGEPIWEEWLQDNRIELNAMTSPQRVAWVEQKFALHHVEKVIPPEEIAQATFSEQLSSAITEQVQAEVLRSQEAWIAEEIEVRLGKVRSPDNIGSQVAHYLKSHRTDRWTHAIDALVERIMVEK